jgi:phage baseplate assembly protein W
MFLERKFAPPYPAAPLDDDVRAPALPAALVEVIANLERILATERGIGHVLPDFGMSQSGHWSHQGAAAHYGAELRQNLARYERRITVLDIDAEQDDDGRLRLVIDGHVAGAGAVTLHVDPLRRRVTVARFA